jgi:hypothetical protein
MVVIPAQAGIHLDLASTSNKSEELDSGLRRNDEQEKHHPHPTLPLKGRA